MKHNCVSQLVICYAVLRSLSDQLMAENLIANYQQNQQR